MIYRKETLSNAIMFSHAYELLINQFHKAELERDKNELGLLFVPVCVNCAFSCELFLKAMLPPGTRGHKLYTELYSKLDPSVAERICNSVVENMAFHTEGYSRDNFESDLKAHEPAFEQWRYFHEGRKSLSYNMVFMRIFQGCLKGIALSEPREDSIAL